MIKPEIGKRYITRDGSIVTITGLTEDPDSCWPFLDYVGDAPIDNKVWTWGESGQYFSATTKHNLDLIEEVTWMKQEIRVKEWHFHMIPEKTTAYSAKQHLIVRKLPFNPKEDITIRYEGPGLTYVKNPSTFLPPNLGVYVITYSLPIPPKNREITAYRHRVRAIRRGTASFSFTAGVKSN